MYHNAGQAMFVYGGYELTAHSAGLSNRLYSLQLVDRYVVRWRWITATDSSQVPADVVVL